MKIKKIITNNIMNSGFIIICIIICIIIFIVLRFLYITYISYKQENYTEQVNNTPTTTKVNLSEKLNTKLNTNNQNKYLTEDLFKDVITYTNDEIDNRIMTFDNLGIGKCLKNKNCKSCVEFGITGTAMCYPESED